MVGKEASIFAHRGLSGLYPENTMAAFQAAREAGAAGIELDVQMTKDGKLAVIHDEKVDRTTNGRGYVKDFTYEQLKLFDAGSWFDPSFAAQSIPLLDMIFEWAVREGNDLIINVELKNDLIRYAELEEKVIGLIQRFQLEDRVIVSSFNPESLKKVRMLHPTLQTGYLFSGIPKNAVKVAQNIGANAIHCEEAFALSDYGREARDAGFPLRIYTVNDVTRWNDLNEAEASVIMTDFPDLFVKRESKL